MERHHRCQAVALLSQTRRQPRLLHPTRASLNPNCTQRTQPPQRWSSCPLPPRSRGISSQIHVARRHQNQQLLHLARPNLRQRLKILSELQGNLQRSPHLSQARNPLHQDRSSHPPHPTHQQQNTPQGYHRTSPMGKTHQHSLQRSC